MEATREKIEYENPLLSLKIWQMTRSDPGYINWHYHPECELLLVQTGRLEIDLSDESYTMESGDVVILGNSQLHRDRNTGGGLLDYIVLQFDLHTFFRPEYDPLPAVFQRNESPSQRNELYFQTEPEGERRSGSLHSRNP
ncbi:cupin domain-containing protein [Cohnella kolymensis]|uniref:cupin domain-containing protein n=1 Tax=Cohnella kolymensis TaxID=1590652 RepID=UPI000ABE4724